MAPRPQPAAKRFWSKVDQGKANECWEWTGARNKPPNHYGFMFRGDDGSGRLWVRAHRLSWEIHNGPIPEGKQVLHHCDNPPCVNPAHLYLGSPAENARDRRARGREGNRRGERNGRAKLTDAQVAEVRRRYEAGGISQDALAAEFKVSQGQISRVVRRLQR